jgi:hypothetical protein
MGSRHHRSASPPSGDDRPTSGGESRLAPGRRPRRSRHGQRLKRRLLALGFGFVLFGLAGVLLTLVAGELGDEHDDPPPAAALGTLALPSAPAARAIAVVMCPGADKSTEHPAYAAACGDRAALKVLLARPAAGNASDPRPEFAGRTPLHHAAQRGDSVMVSDLLSSGADPNLPDAAGHTPLHLVAATLELRHPEFAARRLLDGGARVDLRNARGLTPIEELEAHHQHLLDRQNLAQMLFQKERENQLAQSLRAGSGEARPESAAELVVEVDTAEGRVRIPVDPPTAGPPR